MHLVWNMSALDNPWNSVIMALSELKGCGFEERSPAYFICVCERWAASIRITCVMEQKLCYDETLRASYGKMFCFVLVPFVSFPGHGT